MSLGLTAEEALNCVCRWFSARPLLSTELIFSALEAKSGDFPELPAALMAELCQRLWMFPPSLEEADEWRDRIEVLWGRSSFWSEYATWALGQADDRTYELPNAFEHRARNKIEQATFHCLCDILLKWRQSHGVIAFIKNEGMAADAPPIEDTLLPFELTHAKYHDKVADFGLDSAFLAIGGRHTLSVVPSLCFPTMGRELPEWMDGISGGLPLWFALLATEKSLPIMPLDVGLAGCLSPRHPSLDYHATPAHIVRRKWDLFRRAQVPVVVLPDTGGFHGQQQSTWQFWRPSIPLGQMMQEFVEGQAQRHPDAQLLTHFEKCIVYGDEEIDIEKAYLKLSEMRQRLHGNPEIGRRLIVLLYACCCRLDQGPQAGELEDQLRKIPPPIISEYRQNVRFAAIIAGGVARDRMLILVAEMKGVEQEWRAGLDDKK
jgi:hypothetical protein